MHLLNFLGFLPVLAAGGWHAEGAQSAPVASGFLSRWLAAVLLLLAVAGTAQASTVNCSDAPYFGVIDGNVLASPPPALAIDGPCVIKNWPASHPYDGSPTPTINFSGLVGGYTLAIFDNVIFGGNMSCANLTNPDGTPQLGIWFTNSSVFTGGNQCQSFVIPVEKIDKRSPAASASVGVPFTYTLTIPVMYEPVSGAVISTTGSPNAIGNIHISDDLTAVAIGAEMTIVGISATLKSTGAPVAIINTGDSKHLDFTLPDVPANEQVIVQVTVVLDDVVGNSAGKVFTNTAKWTFSRIINGTTYDPLPGESGVAQPMVIAEPNFVVNKSSLTTAMNVTDTAQLVIDAQNSGGAPAWNTALRDTLPTGMCLTDPRPGLVAVINNADGSLARSLVAGSDYSLAYSGCQLDLTMTAAGGAVGAGQHLVLRYPVQLDPGFTNNNALLTNVAGIIRWTTGSAGGRVYTRTLTDGTPAVIDHQDNHVIKATLTGYYFEKIVSNLVTGANPAVQAAPGDRLRYRLRLFNVDQSINGITITDPVDIVHFDPASFSMVTLPAGAAYTFNAATGLLTVTGSGGPLSVAQGSQLVVEFEISLRNTVANATVVSNQATLAASAFTAISDDPFVNGVADPTVAADEDPTNIAVLTPGPLLKANPALATAAIGQQFTYRITVPTAPVNVPLYDVRVLDDLDASAADLRFVSATVVSGGSWSLSNVGTATNLVLADPATGIDIPANGQAVIDVTVALADTATNQSGLAFSNAATYTYNRVNGNGASQKPGAGNTTAALSVVEPVLTVTKTARNVTAGKAAGDPAAGGDIIEFTITVPNTGNSTAFDTTVTDALPVEMALVAGSATARINGLVVAGFSAAPLVQAGGNLVWGAGNADEALDIPVGQSLVLTFRANVVSATGAAIINRAWVDWSSLNTGTAGERTGAGCPVISLPDDYCAGPATSTVSTVDTNALAKSVLSSPATLRVGDTVDYRLVLTVREGLTRGVAVQDVLPAGLVFDSVVSINGDSGAPYAAVAPFTHADIGAPTVSGGTITWTIGDLANAVDNVIANDQFIIVYRARVANNILPHVANTILTNNATFSYTGGGPRTSSANVEVRQPLLVTLTKSDRLGRVGGSSSAPLAVNVASDVMQFRLEACNALNDLTGPAAPAYGLRLVDTLAPQLDETSVASPVLRIGGVLQVAGTDYTYTPPAVRGGTLVVVLNKPVDPGQCADFDYNIGFHTDVLPNQLWKNSVTSAEYWSLPTPTAVGQKYPAVGPAEFWMTNQTTAQAPTKALVSPATEATIGQVVTYHITVPGTPVNAALSNVVVTDTLNSALVYDGATVAAPFTLTDNSVAPGQVSLAIPQIPAGQQAVITVTAHVANTATSNAGNTFSNQASYSYTGYTGPTLVSAATPALTIVEPLLTVTKAVSPTTPPVAGNVLHYTVNLSAVSGATRSGAFDTGVVDTLSLGLAYVPGTAIVAGVALEPVLSGDGISTPQTLTWSGVDIAEGSTVAVTYDVRVQNGVTPGQVLANNVTARWTSLDGASANERTGSQSSAQNDYVASASTSLGAPDNTTFAKSRLTDTYAAGDANVRIGDHVDFELRLGLQEGTHDNVRLSDVLPTGLVFENVVSATFFGAAGTANPTVSGQTLSWNLGTMINPADGNPANDFVVIVYRARVLNNDTLAQAPTTQALSNSASLTYDVGGVAVLPKTASTAITVLQPDLEVAKSVITANGDTVATAGEGITYTVDISNNGVAPAYDAVLTDTLPLGLRQGGITVTSIRLVTANLSKPLLAPAYNSATGVATWNFDTGVADAYTIPAGDTLRVVYTVQGDASLGAGLTLANAALASAYYSFDDEAVPATGLASQREVYGPSNTAVATLTTPTPGALAKATTQSTASIGDRFTYRITVPAAPASTALHDVRITDDLVASAADLRFVSVARIAGSGTWTPVNTGTTTSLVIEDTANGIDIPAGEQVTVEVTVELLNTPTNVTGLVFSNTANYTYNQLANTPATRTAGQPGTSANMTITGADTLTLVKSGPATMRYGQPGTFLLDVQNTGTARAWDITLTDLLPNPAQGGMCDTAPTVTSVVVADAAGTPLGAALAAGSDYTTAFATGASTCTLTITGVSAAASLAPTQRLRVTYQASLDPNNPPQTPLTNIAAATQWFSQDTAGSGATGETRAYTGPLTNGTVGTLDNQDARTLTTEWPTLQIQKSVINVTTGQNPGSNARPGDRLRYTVHVSNQSPVPLPSFQLRDDLGALNAAAVFVPGSLTLVSAPAGADTTATTANGGTRNAGLVDVRNLSLGVQGSANATADVVFEATLAGVINNGTVVLNQGQLSSFGTALGNTDDPNVNGVDDPAVAGDEDATRTVISAAPAWRVQKVSQDLTGDPAVLLPGDTLRYTLTVKNIGNENALGVILRDAVPSFTTYVPNSTTLNGVAVADVAAGVSALQAGMTIRAPGNATPGAMDADAGSSTANVATISFNVTVNASVVGSTIIANQGFVDGSGAGGSAFPEAPSDDPATSVANDPTRDIVGNLPLLDAQKTVAIVVDNGTPGVADAGDTLRYTISIANSSVASATGVVLTDAVPANTAYVAGSTRLNGVAVADVAGASALAGGLPVNSAGAASGTIVGSGNAVVVFDVQIAAGVAANTVISNQGFVASNEQALEPTDQDGIDTNGDQPTTLIVGAAQQLTIAKAVSVVGAGMANAGGFLDYSVQVTNTGVVPATQVLLRDDLAALGGNASYVAGSALLDGSNTGVTVSGNVISADYGSTRGTLAVGASTVLRFRMQIAAGVVPGTLLTNTGEVSWSTPAQSASSSASIAVGAMPGTVTLNGQAWHDANFDRIADSGETRLTDWTVQVFRGGNLLGSTRTDTGGAYSFAGLAPVAVAADAYEVRFLAPGAGPATASLGLADSAFSNGQQRITGITGSDGSNVQGLNLPITPNGVVYDALLRTPVAGATLTLVAAGSGAPVAASCFADPAQQNQSTLAAGYYKFELNFSDASCPSGGDYLVQVIAPQGYVAGPSQLLPAITSAATAAFDVPSCPGSIDDAVPATATACEAQAGAQAPAAGVASGAGTRHYLHLAFSNAAVPGSSQVFNNHLPLDPRLDNTLAISKTSAMVNVSRGQVVPYVIRVRNPLPVALTDLRLADRFPAGFKYVAHSARLDGVAVEPVSNGLELDWDGVTLAANREHVLKLLMVVGAGVGEGEYVNRAQVFSTITGGAASGEARATVRVVPDPTFDCTDVIGKVFDDANLNGVQDQGEAGLPGVRLATARGLLITTDVHGRFHLTCAVVPDENRGANFIVKLDDRSLPSGYRVITENPEVLRATRGKMLKFSFGAALHKVVRLDLANGVFAPDSDTMRLQWTTRLPLLLDTLKQGPSVLRLAYMAETEPAALVARRLEAVKAELARRWAEAGNPYELTIETEVFWRTGAPPKGRAAP